MDLTALSVARAPVIGSDAIAGVEAQSYSMSADISMFLSRQEYEIFQTLGDFNNPPITGQVNTDFRKAVEDMQAEEAWHITGRITLVVANLETRITKEQAADLNTLISQPGIIAVMYDAVVKSIRYRMQAGEYTSMAIALETHKFHNMVNYG
jgi:hypothetical protein